MAGWLTSFLQSPGLFLAGAALVAVPILIHLLNKRRFRTVEWAAMDFLLEAERRNRRRIRLENLLLLALRCLAVLLVGLLVARPFRPQAATASWLETLRFERIVVLDDSLSMTARDNQGSAFSAARADLRTFVEQLAGDASHNSLTLLLTSQPDRPVFNAVHLSEETLAQVSQSIAQLAPADVPGDLPQALLAVEQSLDASRTEMNQLVYILSDLRARDWQRDSSPAADAPQAAGTPAEVLQRIGERVAGCFVVRYGEPALANLTVERITPQDKALIAGVETPFEVTVANYGDQAASDVEVVFTAGDSLPVSRLVDTVPAAGRTSVPFQFTFAAPQDASAAEPPSPVRIQVELQTRQQGAADRLARDNLRYFAAQLVEGIPTLLVDGDASAAQGATETFWLRSALAPSGARKFGVALDVVTDDELAEVELDDYQVIFLCNLYRLPEECRQSLEGWVSRGGGLAVSLGDQIDQELYHRAFHREGQGLLPLEILERRGQVDNDQWVLFDVQQVEHPMLRVFSSEDDPFRQWVKVFRYWRVEFPSDRQDRDSDAAAATVLARYNDVDSSPAIVERMWGEGRVVCLTTSLDADWNNWPHDYSYAIAMHELVRHLAQPRANQSTVICGAPLQTTLDLARYRADGVVLKTPAVAPSAAGQSEPRPLQPTPQDQDVADRSQTIWQLRYDATSRRGFYEMDLVTHDEEMHQRLFAANLDATESDLRSANVSRLKRDLGDQVQLVDDAGLVELTTSAAKGELWKTALALLVVTLCGEQSLAWWFGRRR